MQQYLESIKLSLETNNHFGAIAMALTLPDICSKIEYEHIKHLKNRERFCKWIDKYLSHIYIMVLEDNGYEDKIILSAKDFYAARCSFLHEGSNITEHQSILIGENNAIKSLTFMSNVGGNFIKNGDFLVFDVIYFCTTVIEAVERWIVDIGKDEIKCSKIKAMPIIHKSIQSVYTALSPFNPVQK